MDNFYSSITDCDLMDVPFLGSNYTWHGGTGMELSMKVWIAVL